MLIAYIYGWNNFKLRAKRPLEMSCYNCNKVGQTNVTKYVKFAHFMWVPIFPYKTINEFECVHCRSVLEYGEMGKDLKQTHRQYISSTPPIWSFSGIIIFIGIFVYFFISNLPDKEKIVSMINSPEVDRIFDYKIDDETYSTFKICSFDDNVIRVVYNTYQADNLKEMERLNEPNFFDQDTIVIEKKELLEQVETGVLLDAHW
jgi:hypothetical protein